MTHAVNATNNDTPTYMYIICAEHTVKQYNKDQYIYDMYIT